MSKSNLILFARMHWVMLVLFSLSKLSYGQLPNGDFQAKSLWSLAQEDWQVAKYSSSMERYERWMEENPSASTSRQALAEFRAAACAIHLQHANAGSRVNRFMENFPEHPLVGEAQWMHGQFLYRKRDWQDAILAFDAIPTRRLKEAEKRELQFKRGHAHFELGAYDEARLDLFSVMESSNIAAPFVEAAHYYFSHISYIKGQPQVALEGFRALESSAEFAQKVPIYIAQLLHETEQYDALISYAPTVMHTDSRINEVQRTDVSRLVGDALYRRQRFEEALPFLEASFLASRGPARTREFAYQMGYTYYRAKSYRKALNCLTLTVREDDSLCQHGLYHMADCYLGLLEKDKARTTFKKASQLAFDSDIQEDALFSYAKLAFELTYNPFDDAIGAIERYLREYPHSNRRDEANGFLLEVYLSSKNYDRALEALTRIETKTQVVKEAYQLISYNRAVELFRAGEYDKANDYFKEVRTYAGQQLLTAESHFWQGELCYLLHRYIDATGHYAAFEASPGAYQSIHYADGIYARGYALFKRKQYTDALSAFRSFLKADPKTDLRKTIDATMRTADCFYANKEFEASARYYLETMQSSEGTHDYAQFQRAACLGSLNQKDDEIAALRALIATAPESSYIPEAMYSLGRACIETNRLDDAQAILNQLRVDHPNSPKIKYALVDLCLIGVKQSRDDDVLALWDIIRVEYGQDPIAGDAFNVIEPLLIDRGLLQDIPSGVGLNGDEIEARLFESARSMAIEGDCEKAIMRLSEYIRSYDNGMYLTEAHFFLGNCSFDMGNSQEAQVSFEYVLKQPVNDFTEPSALAAATLAWNMQALTEAIGHYRTLENVSVLKENVLESRIGLMRCHYLLDEPNEAIQYADQVIVHADTPEEIRRTAQYWRGKTLYDRKDWTAARSDLEAVGSFGGARGAECEYLLCEMSYLMDQFEQTEKELFVFIDAFAAYDNWKYKAFLLLVDTYIALADWFQARATAQSIYDNVSIDWVQAAAQDALNRIELLEAQVLLPEAAPLDSTLLSAPVQPDSSNNP